MKFEHILTAVSAVLAISGLQVNAEPSRTLSLTVKDEKLSVEESFKTVNGTPGRLVRSGKMAATRRLVLREFSAIGTVI
jgi:hypothetical protein